MKISITGHTKGIGLALSDKFKSTGHSVIGFSASTGYDVGKEVARERIFEQSKDCDVFINNAYHVDGQAELLRMFIDRWSGTDKIIINTSTKLVYANERWLTAPTIEYVNARKVQNEIARQAMMSSHPYVINVLLSAVDTQLIERLKCNKLSPNLVADYLYSIVEMRDQLYVQEIVLEVPKQDFFDVVTKND